MRCYEGEGIPLIRIGGQAIGMLLIADARLEMSWGWG